MRGGFADGPICCTLQGEDLFLSQLPEPYRTRALDLIRANIGHVDGFAAVSHYYAGFMCRYLGIPERKMHVVPIGVNLKGYDPSLRLHSNCFTVGFFARVAPKLYCVCLYRFGELCSFSGARVR